MANVSKNERKFTQKKIEKIDHTKPSAVFFIQKLIKLRLEQKKISKINSCYNQEIKESQAVNPFWPQKSVGGIFKTNVY